MCIECFLCTSCCPEHYTRINRFNELKNAISTGVMDKPEQKEKEIGTKNEREKASPGVHEVRSPLEKQQDFPNHVTRAHATCRFIKCGAWITRPV